MREAPWLAPEYNFSRVYIGVSFVINNHLGGSAAPVGGGLTSAVMRGRGRWSSVTTTHTRPWVISPEGASGKSPPPPPLQPWSQTGTVQEVPPGPVATPVNLSLPPRAGTKEDTTKKWTISGVRGRRACFASKRRLLKPLADCSTFTLNHFVFPCGGTMKKTKQNPATWINEQPDLGTEQQGSYASIPQTIAALF